MAKMFKTITPDIVAIKTLGFSGNPDASVSGFQDILGCFIAKAVSYIFTIVIMIKRLGGIIEDKHPTFRSTYPDFL